jgi:acyl-CoA hydrolase
MKLVTAEEAVKTINSRERVFIQSVAAAPQTLIRALTARGSELRGVEIYHLHTEGDAPYTATEYAASFHTNALLSARMCGKPSPTAKPIIFRRF